MTANDPDAPSGRAVRMAGILSVFRGSMNPDERTVTMTATMTTKQAPSTTTLVEEGHRGIEADALLSDIDRQLRYLPLEDLERVKHYLRERLLCDEMADEATRELAAVRERMIEQWSRTKCRNEGERHAMSIKVNRDFGSDGPPDEEAADCILNCEVRMTTAQVELLCRIIVDAAAGMDALVDPR